MVKHIWIYDLTALPRCLRSLILRIWMFSFIMWCYILLFASAHGSWWYIRFRVGNCIPFAIFIGIVVNIRYWIGNGVPVGIKTCWSMYWGFTSAIADMIMILIPETKRDIVMILMVLVDLLIVAIGGIHATSY